MEMSLRPYVLQAADDWDADKAVIW